ncbi:hypothetical protein ACFQ3L_00845 [Lacticaseibacillus jixianensis]|uniref:Uncharacterized protein n=1 Tax=Lacticaseibacillus jixianensis TaxID=2486012 RepID=A0ABW4B7Y2_9LACO|nr:hypothetical protein [Lacticaseibacillus jixianensis]
MRADKFKPHYEVRLAFLGMRSEPTGVATYYPLEPGDELLVETGPGGSKSNGAFVNCSRYGRIRVCSQNIVSRCQRI